MTNFSIKLSQLEPYARKRKALAVWSEAIDRLKTAFPECEDSYDINITGTCDVVTHPATFVPYGETFVPLHEDYDEVESVDIEDIYWDDNDRTDYLEITLISKDVLSSLEDLIASYLDENPDKMEM